MSYQENDKIRVNTNATIEGTFVAYDEQNSSRAKVRFAGISEDVLVPLDAIMSMDDKIVENHETSLQVSEESKKQLERQMQLINFSPKRR